MFVHIMKSYREQFFDVGRLRTLETTVEAEMLPEIPLLKQKRSWLEELQKKKVCLLEIHAEKN